MANRYRPIVPQDQWFTANGVTVTARASGWIHPSDAGANAAMIEQAMIAAGCQPAASGSPIQVTSNFTVMERDANEEYVNVDSVDHVLTLSSGAGKITLLRGQTNNLSVLAGPGVTLIKGVWQTSASRPRVMFVEETPGVYRGDAQSVDGGPIQLKTLCAALMRVRSGTGQAFIGVAGDSTRVGAGAASGSMGLVGASQKSVTAQLAIWFAAQGIPAADNAFFGEHLIQSFPPNVSLASYNPRFAWVGSAAPGGNGAFQSVGGLMPVLNAAGQGLSFTPQLFNPSTNAWANSNVDSAKIWSCNKYTGTWDSNFNGGASLGTVTGSGATTIATNTKTFTRGTGTFNIPWSSGNNAFVGAVLYDSQIPRVNILNFGNYGDKVTSTYGFANNPNEWRGGAAIAAMGLDAVVVDMVINSENQDGLAGIPAYVAALTKLCNDVVGSGADLIIGTPHAIGTAVQTNGVTDAYIHAIKGVAASFGAPVIDFYSRMTPYATYAANFYYDTLHLLAPGYGLDAIEYGRTILQATGIRG